MTRIWWRKQAVWNKRTLDKNFNCLSPASLCLLPHVSAWRYEQL